MAAVETLRSFFVADFAVEGCLMPFACAVTAWSAEDALGLVRETWAPSVDLLAPGVIEELTPEAIQARIGNADFGSPLARGIWYPHVENP